MAVGERREILRIEFRLWLCFWRRVVQTLGELLEGFFGWLVENCHVDRFEFGNGFDLCFFKPCFCVLRSLFQSLFKNFQRSRVFSLFCEKLGQQKSVSQRSVVRFRLLFQEITKAFDRSGIQPGVVEAVKKVATTGPFLEHGMVFPCFLVWLFGHG